MASVAELTARLEKLRKVRASGTRKVDYETYSVEYRSDAELAAAIADVERQIAKASGTSLPGVFYISGSKGT